MQVLIAVVVVVGGSLVPIMCETGPEKHYCRSMKHMKKCDMNLHFKELMLVNCSTRLAQPHVAKVHPCVWNDDV